MDTLIGLLAIPLLLGLPLAYAGLQVLVLRRWAGGWRLAAALPVLGWTLWAANFAYDVGRDPTSHNLFPFEVLIGAGAAAGYLACLALLRRIARARSA